MSSTTDPTPETVDRDFIRRGVELADLNAVRVALYQHTHDPEIAALPDGDRSSTTPSASC